jgi:hypothetical protein
MSNKGIDLKKLVEEAKYLQTQGIKKLSGSICDPDTFAENLSALETLHAGLFSFLAFHPGVDRSIGEYIEKGSIASDSGPNILVFFLSAVEMRFARNISTKETNMGVTLEMNVHPAYQFARWLFPDGAMPQLPGLIFFDHVSSRAQSVYVPIVGCENADEVASVCRSVFAVADTAVTEDISIDCLCRKLKAAGIKYLRNGRTSIGEWLIALMDFAKENRATITSVILKAVHLE